MSYLFIIFLFFTISLYGQTPIYNERWLNNEESGLPQNTIKSIVKDKFGFLWLSTEKGLVRYDGNSFINYQPNLPNVENRTVLIGGTAEDNFLYTYYSSDGVPLLISERTCRIPKEGSPEYQTVMEHNREYLIRILRDETKYPRQRFYFEINRRKYYFLENNRLFYFNGKKEVYLRTFKEYSHLNFGIAGNRLLYVKNRSLISVIEQDGTIADYTTGLREEGAYQIYINYGNKQLFIRNGSKIYLVEYLNGRVQLTEVYDSEHLDRKIIFNCMYYDKSSGTVFIGTMSTGLLIAQKKFIRPWLSRYENNNVFYALSRYSDQEVITPNGEIFSTGGQSRTLFSREGNDKYGILTLKDHSGFLIKDYHKIHFCCRNNCRIITDVGEHNSVYSINEGRDDKIWISVKVMSNYFFTGYLIINDGMVTEKKFYPVHSQANGIHELPDGKLLMACYDGIQILDPKKLILKIYYPAINFRSINSNNDGNIWIQSYGKGLYLYRNGRIYTPPASNSGLLSTIHCVTADDYGYYWMSSNDGLFQVRKKEFIDYYLRKTSDIYLQKYNKSDGLLTNEFNGGANTNGLKLGKYICFPSMNGIVFIDTQHARPILASEQLYTDRMLVNGKEILIKNNQVSLDRDFDYLKIFVDNPNYGNPDNAIIQYKIGADGIWIALAEDHAVNINSLSAGSHDIVFRKLKNFGTDYMYKTLSVYVKPAFWETLFFRIMAAVMLLGMFYLFYKRRLRKIEQEKIVLSQKIEQHTFKLNDTIRSLSVTREELYAQLYRQKKLVTVISHDIKSPLKFINLSASYLMENDSTEAEQQNVLSSIKDSSGKMIDFIESTLTYSKVFIYDNYTLKEDIMLYEFMNQRIRIFENIAEFNAIRVINRIDHDVVISSNPDVLHIVTHNIVDNAIKYTKKGSLTVYSSSDGDRVKLIFEDTGIGMTPDEIERITGNDVHSSTQVGMRIVTELLALVDVPMEIESEKNVGTRIILTFLKHAISD